jgi:ribonuclease E
MVKRKVVISERDNIATLFEGDKAIEFIINRGEMLLGDVYLAEVENILPSIDAAFVNVGSDKMGFLHSSDVQGKGELKTRLHPKQRVIVQVMKEPTGHKGPRVTTNLSLPGRFLVLMPESKGVSISRKIETQAERSRLKSVCSLLKSSGVGVIIRTEAQGQSETDIQEDFEVLMERWQNIVAMADAAKPPALLYRDQDLLYRVIREMVTEDVDELIVDTSFGMQRAQQLLQNWNLDKSIKVTQYTGQVSIMVAKGVEREIRSALQTKVPLPSGGYLYIQPTEALCVIDVNSGRFTSLQSQADTIRITNLESAKEIARQLRLRNIGGMIVVDFIDMDARADKLAVLQAFETELAPDKAKPQVGQLTDLGLVEMTRHRQGQALSEIFGSVCSACNGSGQAGQNFNWASTSAELPDYRSSVAGGSRRGNGRNEGRNSSRSNTSNAGAATFSSGRNNTPTRGGGDARTTTAETSLPELLNKQPLLDATKPNRSIGGLLEEEEFSPSSARSRYGSSRGNEGRHNNRRGGGNTLDTDVNISVEGRNSRRGSYTQPHATVEVIQKPDGYALIKTAHPSQHSNSGEVEVFDFYHHYLNQQQIAFGVAVASSLLFSYPPRTAHNWLCKLNGKSTHVLTILHSLKSQWHTQEDAEEDTDVVSTTDDDDDTVETTEAVDTESVVDASLLETVLANTTVEQTAPETTETTNHVTTVSHLETILSPSILPLPNAIEEKSLTNIVEEVVKPVLMNRLAEQLLSRSQTVGITPQYPLLEPIPVPLTEPDTTVTPTETPIISAVTEIETVYSPLLVQSTEHSEETQESATKQFLVNYLGKLPTAEALLAQSEHNLEATFEASLPGYPEMPDFLFEGVDEEPLPPITMVAPTAMPTVVDTPTVTTTPATDAVEESTADSIALTTDIPVMPASEEEATSHENTEAVEPFSDADEEEEHEHDEDEEDDDDADESHEVTGSTTLPVTGMPSTKPKPKKNLPRSKRVQKKKVGKGKK